MSGRQLRGLVFVAVVIALLGASGSAEWKRAIPDYEWSFPQDHWKHDGYRTEWWYFTGHVESEDGKRFGYQFTFFRIEMSPDGLGKASQDGDDQRSEWATSAFVMGHASISDLDEGSHHFSELLYREIPLLAGFSKDPEPQIGWSRAPAGTSARWWLRFDGEAFSFSMRDDAREMAFTLETRPEKPMILQGPNGFSRKGEGEQAASQYYSFTRLATSGELSLSGTRYRVRGTSWMDKEFSSSQLTEDQVGWDWFSLQLADGWDLMLYRLRRADGSTDFSNGTLVSPDGVAQYLSPQEWSLEAVETWTSPETDAAYPARWRIRVGERILDVRPLLSDQENRSRLPGGVFYWEGAVSVHQEDGTPAGRGYVELTGYGENNRPPV